MAGDSANIWVFVTGGVVAGVPMVVAAWFSASGNLRATDRQIEGHKAAAFTLGVFASAANREVAPNGSNAVEVAEPH